MAHSPSTLKERARLALFHCTSMLPAEALAAKDDEIDFNMMLCHGVKPPNILAARVGAMALQKRGFDTPLRFRQLGFDAGHLAADAAFTNELSLVHGRDATVSAFVVTASDAVAVTGTEAQSILGLTPTDLLMRCAGFPSEAGCVLEQLPHGVSLRGVLPIVVLDAGLRVHQLKACGYSLAQVVEQTGANGRELTKFGFAF